MNQEITGQLRDIHGLDPISWWPPATGWWLVLIGLAVLAWLVTKLFQNIRRYPFGSWQRDAWHQCRDLKARADQLSERDLAADLSELVRRIAIARMGRENAAGLNGEDWLEWLQSNDPHGFNWSGAGDLLLTLPYAPPETEFQQKNRLLKLLDATMEWTDYRNRVVHHGANEETAFSGAGS